MKTIKCKKCGNIIETIPLCCGHDMTLNEETNEWECCYGSDIGYIGLNELLCSKCTTPEVKNKNKSGLKPTLNIY